ncbi:MAG: FadR family transcriptional regulator [Actinobacteria bacterium]|nr:FadR family transcriptional regulator [Actinomycetota bacterium]
MSLSRPFAPLARTTVAEQVRDEIFTRITSGELRPGTQLPAERVLAADFGIARTSVREAIQALVAVGAIERRGNRSYVTERLRGAGIPAADGRMKSVRDLLAARRILERLLFELAAGRATARQRQRALDLARRPVPTSLQELILVDRQFHATIATACANPVLTEAYGRVVEALMMENLSPEILVGVSDDLDETEAITRVAGEHLAIAETFMSGDMDALLEAVDNHVGPIEGWIGLSAGAISRRFPVGEAAGLDRTVGM